MTKEEAIREVQCMIDSHRALIERQERSNSDLKQVICMGAVRQIEAMQTLVNLAKPALKVGCICGSTTCYECGAKI